jgi:uncharacterized protein (TIGR03790 family)
MMMFVRSLPPTHPVPKPLAAWICRLLLGCAFSPCAQTAESRGSDVVVLYNSSMPESRGVAEYYALRRGVPTNQCIGLPVTTREVISRADFESQIEVPLVHELKARGLITTRNDIQPATEDRPGKVIQLTTEARVRYLVVCHGIPLRVDEDPTRHEPAALAQLPKPFHRNGAAVDAELTVLPLLITGLPRTGPLANRWLATTNAAALNPVNGLFVVGRLDAATPELANALVDRALEAEENGLLGRGYFDIRGTTDRAYQPGDQWISNAWQMVSHYGFDTHLDTEPDTLEKGFPLSHVAFYAGWYEQHVNGPFAEPTVEFMPGAVGYHLHSYSAATLRSTNEYWVGPLVARGVTATMGMVDEPFLDGTPDVGLCFARLLWSGFTWGEAVLASQRLLSWQLTVVGDPLYRPFAINVLERMKSLALRGEGRMDWALVMLYNRKHLAKKDLEGVIAELAREPRLRISPILQEKLADFQKEAGQLKDAAKGYERAARWPVSLQQRKRLLLNAAQTHEAAGDHSDAYDAYEELAGLNGPRPDSARLYDRLRTLALRLNRDKDARRWSDALAQARKEGGE